MEIVTWIMAIIITVIYVGIAIKVICSCKTVSGSVKASLAFLGGGVVIIPVAFFIATWVFAVLLIGVVVWVLFKLLCS